MYNLALVYPYILMLLFISFVLLQLQLSLCRLNQQIKQLLNSLLLHRRHTRAHSNRKMVLDHRARQVKLTTGVNRIVQLLRAAVDLLLAVPTHSERDEAKVRLCEDGEQVRSGDELGLEGLAERDAALDVGLQAADAVGAQDEPQLERAEAAAQGDLPVAVVSDELVVAVLVAQVVRFDAEGVDEVAALADPDGGAVKGREHPLVRVQVEGMEVGDGFGQGLVFVEDERGSGVGCVDVDPDLAWLAGSRCQGAGNALEIVNGADVCRAQGGSQVEWLKSLGLELVELRSQSLTRHGEALLF